MVYTPKNIVDTSSLIKQVATRSAEYPPFMASHLPMIIKCMASMGADKKRLLSFIDFYHEEFAVPQQPSPVARIDASNWMDYLGDRTREADYRIFFQTLVDEIGGQQAVQQYLPHLLNGIGGNALHPLMRLAYGILRQDNSEIANALGFWATAYLPFDETYATPIANSNDPIELLHEMQSIEVFRHIKQPPGDDLLWHWIQEVFTVPEYQAFLGRLNPTSDLFERVRTGSVALYAQTLSFEALHAVTGCHWMRIISPYLSSSLNQTMIRRFWEIVMNLYIRLDMPDLPSTDELDKLRGLVIPTDQEIFAAAISSDDEHDISMVFSCFEEFKHTGDAIYPVLAAKRLELV
jgi:hypothetical protein